MKFRYLRDPEECWRSERTKTCVVCKQMRSGYGFITLHADGYDKHHVCEECLITGRLADLGLRVNEGDMEGLRYQLAGFRPDLLEEERERLAVERTKEVEERTPRPNVLNLFTWPVHCGDYGVYERQVFADDLNQIAHDGDGKEFLATHIHRKYRDVDDEFLDNVWEDRLKGFMRFYLWQCPQCSEFFLTYDSD